MPHIHELYDFTASAYIVRDGKILLHKHLKLNSWLQPGGHIELDENPEQALWREVEEETGLMKSQLKLINTQQKSVKHTEDTLTLPVPFDINVHKFDEKHQHIDLSYLMTTTVANVAPSTDKESTKLRWFDRSELDAIRPEMHKDVYVRCVFALDFTAKCKNNR